MKFACTIHQLADGRWSAEHHGKDVGDIAVVADSRDQAVEKLRGELRYRLELCPCSGESYQHLDIEVVGQNP